MIRELAIPEGEDWLMGFIPVHPEEWGFLAPYWWDRKLRRSVLPLAYAKAVELSRLYGVRYRVMLRQNGWVVAPVPQETPC